MSADETRQSQDKRETLAAGQYPKFEPNIQVTQPKRKTGLPRLLQLAGTMKPLLMLSAVLAVGNALLTLVPYLLVYWIIMELTAPAFNQTLVWQYLVWAAGAAILGYVFMYASSMASHVAAFNILYALRKKLAEKISRLPLGFVNRKSSGAVKKILSDDVERIEGFVAHHLPDFIKGVALPFITLIVLFVMDWRLALASLIPFALVLIIFPYFFINKKNKQRMKEYLDHQEKMSAVIVEYVRAMPVVKIFNQTTEAFGEYRESVLGFRDRVKSYMRSQAPPYAIIISFVSNNLLPVLAIGLWLYFDGSVELAVLLFFFILGVGYVKPLFALANIGSQLYLVVQGVGRMDEILYAEEVVEPEKPQTPDKYDVVFDQVTFAYDEQGLPALDQVSFTVPQGSVTAFVGPSGAGKSTAAQLLARFWDVQQGSIRIGGVDLREMSVEQLYRTVSFVFQDAFLFQDTIYENIRMGLDVTRDEVMAAAKAAQCHDLIMQLPEGYETRVGERGTHFSGGEQQRIMLARAVLRDAPILILDEATAFADPDNEAKIQAAFSALMKDKTVIVIAHRLSTIIDSDRIILFDDGKVQQIGTHDQLLETSSLYARMWDAHQRAKSFRLEGAYS
jgi:ATP-binding cassette subfamily B protein IrtA